MIKTALIKQSINILNMTTICLLATQSFAVTAKEIKPAYVVSKEPYGSQVKITKFKKKFDSNLTFRLIKKEKGRLVFQSTSSYQGFTREVITASQNWSVPSSASSVKILVMGGGGGGSSQPSSQKGGNGGGAGQIVEAEVTVTPGSTIPITIGAGGALDTNGGTTSFGTSGNAWYTYATGGVAGCGGTGSSNASNSCGDNGGAASLAVLPTGVSMGGRGGNNGTYATAAKKSLLGKCTQFNSYCAFNGGLFFTQSLGGKPTEGYFGWGGIGGNGGTVGGLKPSTGTGFGAGGVGLPSYYMTNYQNMFDSSGNIAIGGGGAGGFVGIQTGSVAGMSVPTVANTRPNTGYNHSTYVSSSSGFVINGYVDGSNNGATNTSGVDGVVIIEY